MSFKSLLIGCFVFAGILFFGSIGHADFESKLLKKFQKQNATAADKLKATVAKHIEIAESQGSTKPSEILVLLRTDMDKLQKATGLTTEDRSRLLTKLQAHATELEQLIALEKQKHAAEVARLAEEKKRADMLKKALTKPQVKRSPYVRPKYPLGVSPILAATPRIVIPPSAAAPFSANFQVTPVVSADRRFVRVGLSGTFVVPNYSAPLVPIQIPVPTVLLGPGKGITVGRPEKIFQVFVPRPAFSVFGVNTTATAPTGGVRFVGGFQNGVMVRNEFGVPGLGGIPYVGRLFRNVGYGSQFSGGGGIYIAPRVFGFSP